MHRYATNLDYGPDDAIAVIGGSELLEPGNRTVPDLVNFAAAFGGIPVFVISACQQVTDAADRFGAHGICDDPPVVLQRWTAPLWFKFVWVTGDVMLTGRSTLRVNGTTRHGTVLGLAGAWRHHHDSTRPGDPHEDALCCWHGTAACTVPVLMQRQWALLDYTSPGPGGEHAGNGPVLQQPAGQPRTSLRTHVLLRKM